MTTIVHASNQTDHEERLLFWTSFLVRTFAWIVLLGTIAAPELPLVVVIDLPLTPHPVETVALPDVPSAPSAPKSPSADAPEREGDPRQVFTAIGLPELPHTGILGEDATHGHSQRDWIGAWTRAPSAAQAPRRSRSSLFTTRIRMSTC